MIASTRKTYSRSLSPASPDGLLPALPRKLCPISTPAHRLLRLLVLLWIVVMLPVRIAAQTNVDLTTLPLEQLMNIDVQTVYGASRIEQKTTEAPSSVTIIRADEIKKYGYRTLTDVLGSVQGF